MDRDAEKRNFVHKPFNLANFDEIQVSTKYKNNMTFKRLIRVETNAK